MAQLMTNGTSPVGTVPACFHSELAEKTSWTPLARQTMSFCSHRLGPDPMTGGWRFRSTAVLRLFGILPTVFVVVTLGILLLAGKLNPLRTLLAELPILYVIVAGACIGSVVIGVWLWRRMNPVIVFDGLREAFYRAPRNPRGMEVAALDSFTPFQEIGALQLLERDRAGRQRPSVRGRPVRGGRKWKNRPGLYPPVLLHDHKKRVPAKTIRIEGLHTKIAV